MFRDFWLLCACGVALTAAFTPDFSVLEISKVRLSDLLIAVWLGWALCRLRFSDWTARIRHFPLSGWIALLLIWDTTAWLLHGGSQLGFFYLARRVTGPLLAFLTFWATQSDSARRKVFACLSASTFLLACSVLLDAGQKRWLQAYLMRDQLRADGLFLSGQEVSSGLCLLLVTLVWCAQIDQWSRRVTTLLTLGVLLNVAALVSTGTRSLLAALIVSATVLLASSNLHKVRRAVAALATSALIVGLLGAAGAIRERLSLTGFELSAAFQSLAAPAQTDAPSSLAARVVTIQHWLHNTPSLAFGNGTGEPRLGIIDNFYVTEICYHGLFGLALYLGLLLWIWRLSSRPGRNSEWHSRLSTGTLAGLAGLLLAGLTSEAFYLARSMEVFWILVGLSLPPAPPSLERLTPGSKVSVKLGILLLLLLTPGFMGLATGRTPVLRGVNDSGAEWDSYQARGQKLHFSSQATRDYVADCGLQLIRLPVSWECLQPVPGGPLDLGAVQQVKAYLHSLSPRLRLILDIHNFGKYRLNEKEYLQLGSARLTAEDFARFWGLLATEFKDEPLYAYGLMNEPNCMNTTSWKEASQAAVREIRKTGDRHKILVGGSNWSSTALWQACHGTEAWISDPLDNFAYEGHLYFDRAGAGTYPYSYTEEALMDPDLTKRPVQKLRPFLEWCQENGVEAFIGEVGCPPDPQWCSLLDSFLSELDRTHTGATLWAIGDRWPRDYKLSMQPSAGLHSPQMQILLAHRGGRTGSFWSDWTLGYELAYRRSKHFLRALRAACIGNPNASTDPVKPHR